MAVIPRFVSQSHEILKFTADPVGLVAGAARTCYLSEPKDEGADERLVRSLVRNGHHAMLEFGWAAVRFRTSRAIANEIVRHRLLSFAQESTRYVNYGKRGFQFIRLDTDDEETRRFYERSCRMAAENYVELLEHGVKPEIARDILPLGLATTICCAGNLREWRHVFELRTSEAAHPQIRELMRPVLEEFAEIAPAVFDDLL